MNINKKKVIVVFVILVFVLLQRYMMKNDINLVREFKQPRFCIAIDSYKDDGGGKYLGFGYSFNIRTSFPEKELPAEVYYPDFTQYVMNIFGIEVADAFVYCNDFEFEGEVYKMEKIENSDSYYIYLDDIGVKKIVVSSKTSFQNTNAENKHEVKKGDIVNVYALFFKELAKESTDNWVYSASKIEFIETEEENINN